MKKDWKFWHWDHVGVCLTTALIAAVIGLVSVNLSMFNPVEQAFENFHMTDVYYEMSRGDDIELNDDIVLVDMTELIDRGEIAQLIQQINACKPKVLSVDLLFPKEGDDVLANAMLVSAIDEAEEPVVLSSKLIGYDEEQNTFSELLASFFAPLGDYTFACLQIIEDSEREEYIGHKLYDIKIEKAKEENPLGGLIDYIKNHIFASVVIGIVILVFIAIMVNICRSERRKAGGLDINVNEVKGELISKD